MISGSIFTNFTFALFLFSLAFILITNYIDSRRKKPPIKRRFISFIMPSYNDADTLEESVRSIFKSCKKGHFEVFVVNDCSKDNTLKILKRLKKEYDFTIINNRKNIGKVSSINNTFRLTKGEVIVMIDSDTQISAEAVNDILARLSEDGVGGVSCRYLPVNKSFLASMQTLEYAMMGLVQSSYNLHSTIGFWGGCMAVKREVFIKVGLLSQNCIVEDSDLALKIGEAGWRAQESSVPVDSHVPDKFLVWYKQKIRWAAGSMQNIINHFSFYMKNPIAIFFLVTYTLISTSFLVSTLHNVVVAKELYHLFESFRLAGHSFITSVGLTKISYGLEYLKMLAFFIIYPLFSIPYVLFNYNVAKKPFTLLLIFPFSMIYIPIFSIVMVIGFLYGVRKYFALDEKDRGW
jgi:cellulose synthase/poly-beta-1,6-N-acetylglucosamine synthase-like glycosyltransferase